MIIEKAVEIFIINRLLEENIMNKELISKNYLYVSNAIKEFHFLECCLFSNYSVYFFIFGKACFNRTYVSVRLRLQLAFNSCLVCEDSIKVIVNCIRDFLSLEV